MPRKNAKKFLLLFRIAPDELSSTAADGSLFSFAPVGEPEGPFVIAILKFRGANGTAFDVYPVTKPVATRGGAVAQLSLGFVLDMPKGGFPEPVKDLVSRAMVDGLIQPVMQFYPEQN